MPRGVAWTTAAATRRSSCHTSIQPHGAPTPVSARCALIVDHNCLVCVGSRDWVQQRLELRPPAARQTESCCRGSSHKPRLWRDPCRELGLRVKEHQAVSPVVQGKDRTHPSNPRPLVGIQALLCLGVGPQKLPPGMRLHHCNRPWATTAVGGPQLCVTQITFVGSRPRAVRHRPQPEASISYVRPLAWKQ